MTKVMENITVIGTKVAKKKIMIILIAAVLLVGLIVSGFIFWNKWKKPDFSRTQLDKAGEMAEELTEEATKGTLPSLGTNPLKNKPDINPADKANPFKNMKTNPFE